LKIIIIQEFKTLDHHNIYKNWVVRKIICTEKLKRKNYVPLRKKLPSKSEKKYKFWNLITNMDSSCLPKHVSFLLF